MDVAQDPDSQDCRTWRGQPAMPVPFWPHVHCHHGELRSRQRPGFCCSPASTFVTMARFHTPPYVQKPMAALTWALSPSLAAGPP